MRDERVFSQGEARSATARADAESLILVSPAEIFELYLKSDDGAPRRLIVLPSDRLREANSRLGPSG